MTKQIDCDMRVFPAKKEIVMNKFTTKYRVMWQTSWEMRLIGEYDTLDEAKHAVELQNRCTPQSLGAKQAADTDLIILEDLGLELVELSRTHATGKDVKRKVLIYDKELEKEKGLFTTLTPSHYDDSMGGLTSEMDAVEFLNSMPDDDQPRIADGELTLDDEVAWQNEQWRNGVYRGRFEAVIAK